MNNCKKRMEQNETIEVGGGEETETKFFLQEVTKYDDSLDLSNNSLQGSMSFPSFTVGQSNDLQGSQGFQIGNLSFSQRNDDSNKLPTIDNSGSSGSGLTCVTSSTCQFNPCLPLQRGAVIFQGSPFGALNVMQTPEQYQVLIPSELKDSNSGQSVGGTVAKREAADIGVPGDVFEGGSSDEKSGKCKTSPKRRGRKSRSTSSTGNEMAIKSEAMPGPSPCRMDASEQQQSGADMGFKPSLLDEILTEKKMALMRSPDVIKFLQAQQQQQVLEKSLSQGQQTNS